MILVADESVDFPVIKTLENTGYSIFAIVKECPGISDDQVLEIAIEKGALLLTADKDFGALVIRNRVKCAGVVLLRLHTLSAQEMAICVKQAFTAYQDKLPGAFTVIQEDQVRIRPI